jgi:hypothetical protein
MTPPTAYLSGERRGAHWMRLDTARVLKRFFFCERSLLLSLAAHLPAIGPLEIKTGLPRFIWQNALTAHALRERIFELRFPSRLLEIEADAPLVALFDAARDAPSPAALLQAVSTVFAPALRDSYRAYLAATDSLADGPTHRFLQLALTEKEEQVRTIGAWAEKLYAEHPEQYSAAQAWVEALGAGLARLGHVGIMETLPAVEAPSLPGARPYHIPDRPARDIRFLQCRFYWPDILDPDYGYGEGVSLQLRSAVSHLNEAWAVETAGLLLNAFADTLPWEWVVDAARWTYDEARHCAMGYERLLSWGFDPASLPLGTYIYDSAAGQDPIYRLGMLFFFETLNIKKKPKRAELFRSYGDAVSEHDMEFDWADETIHAGYGKRWLGALVKARGEDAADYDAIRSHCRQLVEAYVETATDEERQTLLRVAVNLIQQAQTR